jgi:hypothetical protein
LRLGRRVNSGYGSSATQPLMATNLA